MQGEPLASQASLDLIRVSYDGGSDEARAEPFADVLRRVLSLWVEVARNARIALDR